MASVKNIASVQWSLVMAVIALGVTTIITQIIFLREFLSIFYGNELVIGITLANWLILTGIGSFIGSVSYKLKNKIRTLIAIITFQAILPITTVFLIRFLKNIVFDVGSMIGINQILFTSFVILIPFCIISGLSFTLLSEILSQRVGVNFIPNVYALESLGSMIGGVFFSFIMIYFFETFQSLLILMVFNIIIAYLLSINHNKIVPRILLVVLATFLLIAEFMWNLDTLTLQFLFKNQEIIYHKDTPYGNLVITRKGEQNNFYENNVLLFSTNDPTMNEEAVHYGMIQHSNPKKVLLISGGISGTLEEILK